MYHSSRSVYESFCMQSDWLMSGLYAESDSMGLRELQEGKGGRETLNNEIQAVFNSESHLL